MARMGEEFPLECPSCGGNIRLIAFIIHPGPIRKILTHRSPGNGKLGRGLRRRKKNASAGGAGSSREPAPEGRNDRSRRSRVVRKLPDRCNSAIDRATLLRLSTPPEEGIGNGRDRQKRIRESRMKPHRVTPRSLVAAGSAAAPGDEP